jgi:glucosylceramidase
MITDRFFRHYLTAKASKDRMAEKSPVLLDEDPDVHLPSVSVDPSKRFQTIEGFGGAFTEASAVSLSRMRKEHREQLFKAYFHHTDGHGYSLCRTHMNSCDFSLGNYACTEVDGDVELKHFSIDRDRRALLPMIKEAQKAAGEPLKILVSPWSPPAWMERPVEKCGG